MSVTGSGKASLSNEPVKRRANGRACIMKTHGSVAVRAASGCI